MTFTLGHNLQNPSGLFRWRSVQSRFAALLQRPWLLLSLVLLVNAVFRPYYGLVHDACLYGLQSLNHAEGAFANDLYLRYGSQDSYSVFSSLMRPLVGLLGVRVAFFLVYLVANGCFYFAVQRLTLRLVKSPVFAVASLLLVAASPMWFGGLNVFQANENFLTPRILANALVLVACERMLVGRMGWALCSITVAMMLHPVMGFSGLLVWLGLTLFDRCSPRVAFAILGACAAAALAVLVIRPLGVAIFGEMDADWKDAVKCGNYYAFLSEWLVNDWLRIASAFGSVMAAALCSAEKKTRQFLGTLALVGLAGVVGSWIANYLPYAVLFQGQPYRTLWLLQLLAVPAGLQLAYQLWHGRKTVHRVGAVAIIFSFAFSSIATAAWATIFVCVALVGRSLLCAKSVEDGTPTYQLQLITWAAICSFLVLSLPSVAGTAALVVEKTTTARDFVAPLFWYRAMFLSLGPGLAVLLAVGIALVLLARISEKRLAAGALFATMLVVQAILFATPRIVTSGLPMYKDAQFVKGALPSDRHLTVHWPYPSPKFIWFDLHANSFFSWQQTAGSMFNRATAMEAQRRAQLVASIDLNAFDAADWTSGEWELKSLLELYAADRLDPVPTLAELQRLAEEPGLDYVLSRHRFAALYETTNGRWYIYNCERLRKSIAEHGTLAALGQ